MTLSQADVRRLAALANIEVDDAVIDELVTKLARTLEYVHQLAAIPDVPADARSPTHPPQVSLRPDVVDPLPLAVPLSALAPEMRDQLLVVPRLPGVSEDPS